MSAIASMSSLHKKVSTLEDQLKADREAVRRQQSEIERQGIDAMKHACNGLCEPPMSLVEAAPIIKRLRERLEAAESMVQANEQKFVSIEGISKQVWASLVDGEPESQHKPSSAAVWNCIKRLRAEAQDARTLAADVVKRIRDTFTDMGLTAMPGITNYFSGATPMLTAIEGAVIEFVYQDIQGHPQGRVEKEAYLRRRGWKFTGGSNWRDVVGMNLPFASAVKHQVKLDLTPFRGLAARDWKGVEAKIDPVSNKSEIALDVPGETGQPADSTVPDEIAHA